MDERSASHATEKQTHSELEHSDPKQHFTIDWFSPHIQIWEQLVARLPSRQKFLEIGSFEGRSACWMLEHALADDGELYCIDTWAGSPEFGALPAGTTAHSNERFRENVRLAKKEAQAVRVFKNTSVRALANLVVGWHIGTFDLIYIDGSHMVSDVLSDACMSWPLLKPGGVMIFDDYLWSLNAPISMRPKAAIDAFTMLFNEQLLHLVCGDQYAVQKK